MNTHTCLKLLFTADFLTDKHHLRVMLSSYAHSCLTLLLTVNFLPKCEKLIFFLDPDFRKRKISSIYSSEKNNSSCFKRISLWFFRFEQFSQFDTIQKSAQSLLTVAQKYFFRDDTRSTLFTLDHVL